MKGILLVEVLRHNKSKLQRTILVEVIVDSVFHFKIHQLINKRLSYQERSYDLVIRPILTENHRIELKSCVKTSIVKVLVYANIKFISKKTRFHLFSTHQLYKR